jgi:hypothetical protein
MAKNSFPYSAVNSDVNTLQLTYDIGSVLQHSWDALKRDGEQATEQR